MKAGFAVKVDKGLESTVFNHFGSAPAFIIVDTELNRVETLKNSNAKHAPGTCNPAAALGGKRVDVVVVGSIGTSAIMKMNKMGIKVLRAGAAKVSENMDLLVENKLNEISPHDSCSRHHGRHCRPQVT